MNLLNNGRVLRAVIALALVARAASAATLEVDLQLVVHNETNVTVEKKHHNRWVTEPVRSSSGVKVQLTGIATSMWARHVLLVYKPTFERF